MNQKSISETVLISATPELVWHMLTDKSAICSWIGEKELNPEIDVVWEEGQLIKISGFHHEAFENTGKVLRAEKPHVLSYTQLSSISRLPDLPENYHIITFTIRAVENGTELNVAVSQFPTESIFLHLQLYWKPTLNVIKQLLEKKI